MTFDFKGILDAVEMDPNARKVFLAMPREEQLLAILGMQAWVRSELVNVKKDVLELRQDLDEFEDEAREYRFKRERRETKLLGDLEGDEHLSTTQKIIREITKERLKQFDFWLWFRDKVLPTMVVVVMLALLGLAFGVIQP